jgi:hypothetical protein
MIEELKRFWTGQADWAQMIVFCARMTALRADIRQSGGIKSPLVTCPKCGKTARSEPADITPRSALFALRKAGVLSDVEMGELEKGWSRFRKVHDLDSHGRKTKAQPPGPGDGNTRA